MRSCKWSEVRSLYRELVCSVSGAGVWLREAGEKLLFFFFWRESLFRLGLFQGQEHGSQKRARTYEALVYWPNQQSEPNSRPAAHKCPSGTYFFFFNFWLAIARQNLFYTFSVVINLFFQSTFIFCLAEFASAGRCGMIFSPIEYLSASGAFLADFVYIEFISYFLFYGLLPISIHLAPIADHGHRPLDL